MALQGLPDKLVLDLIWMIRSLTARVLNTNFPVQERWIDAHVHVLVDPHGEDKPTVLVVVRGQVRTASTQGDAKWRTRKDHDPDTYLLLFLDCPILCLSSVVIM